MPDMIFLVAMTCLLGLLLAWGFKHLPGERWQMLAVIPKSKDSDERWQGVNLTYYGFFLATGQIFAVVLLMILLGAAGVSLAGTLLATALILGVCIPASRIVAILVEKKRHTFTIGGASFVGIALAPLVRHTGGKNHEHLFRMPPADAAGSDSHGSCLYPGRGVGAVGMHQLRLLLR